MSTENYHQIYLLGRRALALLQTLKKQDPSGRILRAEDCLSPAVVLQKDLLHRMKQRVRGEQETIPFNTPRGGLLTEAAETLESAIKLCDKELIPGNSAWPEHYDLLAVRLELRKGSVWISIEQAALKYAPETSDPPPAAPVARRGKKEPEKPSETSDPPPAAPVARQGKKPAKKRNSPEAGAPTGPDNTSA